MTSVDLKVRVDYGIGITFVSLNDEYILEADRIEKLKEIVLHAVEKTKDGKMMMNFTNVQSISSAMLGLLVVVHKRLREKGSSLELCNLDPNVRKVFEITNLTKVFNIS